MSAANAVGTPTASHAALSSAFSTREALVSLSLSLGGGAIHPCYLLAGASPIAAATRFLPPGPVLITIKGAWPPVSDTPTALGSIEVREAACHKCTCF
eukprot:SAG11_NODE_1298_length_5265_cov_3.096787_7_plen_98_part_00